MASRERDAKSKRTGAGACLLFRNRREEHPRRVPDVEGVQLKKTREVRGHMLVYAGERSSTEKGTWRRGLGAPAEPVERPQLPPHCERTKPIARDWDRESAQTHADGSRQWAFHALSIHASTQP